MVRPSRIETHAIDSNGASAHNAHACDEGAMKNTRQTVLGMILALGLLAWPLRAAETPLSTSVARIGRSDVVQRAMAAGPGVNAARVGGDGATRLRSAASTMLSVPPRLEVDVARRSYPGGAGMDVTAALWQDLSLGGLGAAKRDYADATVETRRIELELARRRAVHEAMLAWIDAWHARALVELRSRNVEVAEQMASIAQARVQGGDIAPVELTLARSVVGAARASLLEAHGRSIEADARLRHALALPPDVRIEIVGDLTRSDDTTKVDERAHIERVLSHHPLVRLAQSKARRYASEAELESARGRPFLGVGVSYGRETTGDRIVGVGVAIPLPVLNPSAFESTALRGEADVSRMVVRDTQEALAREIRVALHEREHARELRAMILGLSLQPARAALVEVLKRYELGAVGLIETLSVRKELLSTEEAYLEACASVHRADANLEYVAAGPVFGRSGI